MKQLIKFAAFFLIVAGSVACKKNKNESDNTAKTKTELLTAGSWKRTALISNPAYDWYADGTFATDILKCNEAFEKDNFDTYKAGGIVETDEGPTKCNPSDPQIWTATWTFADNETKLIFDGTDEYTLLELTSNTLKFQSTFVENGSPIRRLELMGIKSFLSVNYANMKPIIKFAILATFIAGLAFASCKKETAVSSSLPVVVTPAQTNKPPVANAGADVALMLACSQKAGFAELDGSKSSDPDNNIV